MKRIIFTLILSFVCLTGVFAKSLVVFYSLTGTTKAMAERIAKETGSDIFELQLANPYSLNGTKCSDESKADRKNNTPRKIKSGRWIKNADMKTGRRAIFFCCFRSIVCSYVFYWVDPEFVERHTMPFAVRPVVSVSCNNLDNH